MPITPVNDTYAGQVGSVIAGGRLANVRPTFSEGQAATYSLSQQFPDIDGHAVSLRVASGVLPAGVTLDPLGKVLKYDGSLGVNNATVSLEAIPNAPTLQIIGEGTNLPIMAGICFPKGVVFGNLGASQPGLHVTNRRLWNDGSVKHAVVSGVANAGDRVTFNTVPASGTNLTHSDILAVNPSVSVDLGAFGAGTLSELLAAGPHTTWLSTPGVVDCHYRKNLTYDGSAVEFQVRLFSNGAIFIRVLVENGKWLRSSIAGQLLTGVVVIDGVTVYSYNNTDLMKNSLHIHERWVGNTQYTHLARNDAYQVMQTKLVPHYGMATTVPESALAALHQDYVIGSKGDFSYYPQGTTGEQRHIGLLPNWDAQWLITNDDRAFRSLCANAKTAFHWPSCWRENGRMLIPTDHPNATYSGEGGGGAYPFQNIDSAGNSWNWDDAHQGSMGYLAYLLTGDEIYAEAMLGNCATNFQIVRSSDGSGINRVPKNNQMRGVAWYIRTIGQTTSVIPDSISYLPTLQSWLVSSLQYFANMSVYHATAAASTLGWVFTFGSQDTSHPLTSTTFEHAFLEQSLGLLSDTDAVPSANQTLLTDLRNWTYRGIIGVLGHNNEFCFTLASYKYHRVSDEIISGETVRTASQLYSSWAQVYANGYPGHVCSTSMESGPGSGMGAGSYLANLFPAISYAVDHGFPGAQEAWDRLTSVPNWSTIAGSTWGSFAPWGVTPRSETPSKVRSATFSFALAEPAWAPTAGQIKNISYAAGYFGPYGGATLAEINPNQQNWNPQKPAQGPYKGTEYYWDSINGYSGCCWDSDSRRIVNYGAGHASINVCAPFCFDLSDLKWKWLDTPLPFDGFGRVASGGYSVPPSQAVINTLYPNGELDYVWGELNGDSPAWEATWGAGPWLRPGKIQPIPGHTRNVLVHIPASVLGNGKGGLFKFGSASGMLSGSSSYTSHIFDYDTGTWRRTSNACPFFGNGISSTAQSSLVDVQTKTCIHYGGGNQFKVFDFTTDAWRALRVSSNSYPGSGDTGNCLLMPHVRLLWCAFARTAAGAMADYDAQNGRTFDFFAIDIDAIVGSGSFGITKLTVSAQSTWPLRSNGHNGGIGWGYCPENHCFYSINGSYNSTKYWKLSPPAGAVTQAQYLSGTWSLTEHTFDSGVLSSPGGFSWVFNRLTWDSLSRSFLWFPDNVSGPVQAFRPHGL